MTTNEDHNQDIPGVPEKLDDLLDNESSQKLHLSFHVEVKRTVMCVCVHGCCKACPLAFFPVFFTSPQKVNHLSGDFHRRILDNSIKKSANIQTHCVVKLVKNPGKKN